MIDHLVEFLLGFSPPRSVDHLKQKLFRHWVLYTLDYSHCSVEAIGKRLVSAFSHEHPLVVLPFALDDLPIHLLQLLVHLFVFELLIFNCVFVFKSFISFSF